MGNIGSATMFPIEHSDHLNDDGLLPSRAGSDGLGCEFDSKSYSSSELGLLCPAMFGSLQMSCGGGLGPRPI
jgi:hypothetical protein